MAKQSLTRMPEEKSSSRESTFPNLLAVLLLEDLNRIRPTAVEYSHAASATVVKRLSGDVSPSLLPRPSTNTTLPMMF